jgi:hypothetical protein
MIYERLLRLHRAGAITAFTLAIVIVNNVATFNFQVTKDLCNHLWLAM